MERKKLYNWLFCLLIALLLSVFPVLMFIWFCTPSHITFSGKVTLGSDGYIQLYYLEKEEQKSWQALKSCRSKDLKGGVPTQVELTVPVSRMKFLRMDVKSKEKAHHRISSLKLKGVNKNSLRKLKIEKESARIACIDGSRTLQISPQDAVGNVIFKTSRTLYGAKECFRSSVFIYAAICFVLFTFCMLRIRAKRADERKSDWLFIVCFLLLMAYPCIDIDKSDVAANENRRKAVFPQLYTREKGINNDFGRQFDAWFSDRFCGRDSLISFWQKLQKVVNSINLRSNGWVVKGHCGWHFFQLDNSIENFQNMMVFSKMELQENLAALKAVKAECDANGIKFYYFVAPDKNKIYGEMLPYYGKIRPDSESRLAQWVNYVRENSDIKVIWPLEELKAQKEKDLVYYKTDTHWNKLGAYHGYLALCKVLKKDFPDFPVNTPWKWLEESNYSGDMNKLCPDFVAQDTTVYKRPVPKPEFQQVHNLKQDYVFANPAGKYSLLLLRDSFSNNLLPFLYSSFKNVHSVWRYELHSGEIKKLKEKKVDILILEHVERYLPAAMEKIRGSQNASKAGGK